jgi:glycerol-3-phosphate acyltransferase PlsY
VDLIVSALALAGGYLVGSIPLSAMIGRASGDAAIRTGDAGPGVASVWKLAGPGWGLLALTGDVAKGLLPVAIGVVTWSWWTGLAAGLGALLGAGWPLLGRLPGGRGIAVMTGALVALSPAAGLVSLLLAAVAAGAVRLAGRSGLTVAIAAGLAAYPVLFLLDHADPARLAGIAVLYLIAGLRTTTIRH